VGGRGGAGWIGGGKEEGREVGKDGREVKFVQKLHSLTEDQVTGLIPSSVVGMNCSFR